MPTESSRKNNINYNPIQRTSDEGSYNDYMRTNQKNYDNFKYFLEGIDVTDQNLDQLTPYIPGISRLYFHKVPYFMSKQYEELTDNFRSYLETGFKSVSGIGNLTAEGIDVEGGWAAQKFSNMSIVRDDTDTITIELTEMTGSPVREFIETWMTGIRDPRSGVAHYHGAVESPTKSGIPYCERNHTGEFIYVALDPTAQYIEYACLLAHVWPKNVPKEHYNYQSGSRDVVTMSLEFAVTKYEGRYINDIAAYYLAASNLKYNYLEFNPMHDKDGGNLEIASYVSGISPDKHAGTNANFEPTQTAEAQSQDANNTNPQANNS